MEISHVGSLFPGLGDGFFAMFFFGFMAYQSKYPMKFPWPNLELKKMPPRNTSGIFQESPWDMGQSWSIHVISLRIVRLFQGSVMDLHDSENDMWLSGCPKKLGKWV